VGERELVDVFNEYLVFAVLGDRTRGWQGLPRNRPTGPEWASWSRSRVLGGAQRPQRGRRHGQGDDAILNAFQIDLEVLGCVFASGLGCSVFFALLLPLSALSFSSLFPSPLGRLWRARPLIATSSLKAGKERLVCRSVAT